MAKTDWQMGDTVQPEDLNQMGQEINENAAAITNHVSDTSGVHGATSAATPNSIVQRDAAGRFKAAAPSASDDVARKVEVDAVQNNLNSHKSAAVLDHPDGSVTTSKLADRAVTTEKLSQQYSTAVNAGYNEDPNTTEKAYILTKHDNTPLSSTFWHIRTFFYLSTTGNRAQLAIRYNGPPNQMFIRYHYDGEWSSWTEIATSERGFFNTDLVLPNGKGLYVRDTDGNVQVVGAINSNNNVLLGDADLPTHIRGTNVRINGNIAWHSGNDGTGSGLDADMLDGIQGNRFIYGDNERGSTLFSGGDLNNIIKTGFYHTSSATLNQPPEISSGFVLHVNHPSNNSHAFQICQAGTGNSALFYYRRKSEAGWVSWQRFWTEGSDGPGSGLDADTVSGYGLGTVAKNISGTNLNSLVNTGFYRGNNLSNAPNSTHYYFVIHIQWNETTALQILYRNSASGYQEVYHRLMNSGAWQPWVTQYNSGNLPSDRIRKITISKSSPSGGSDGDIWIQY